MGGGALSRAGPSAFVSSHRRARHRGRSPGVVRVSNSGTAPERQPRGALVLRSGELGIGLTVEQQPGEWDVAEPGGVVEGGFAPRRAVVGVGAAIARAKTPLPAKGRPTLIIRSVSAKQRPRRRP